MINSVFVAMAVALRIFWRGLRFIFRVGLLDWIWRESWCLHRFGKYL